MKITTEYKKLNSFGFDFMIPKDKNWFGPNQVSKILGSSDQYVRNCIYSGKIFAHVAIREGANGTENKSYIRIHRQAIEMYLLETANYTNDLFLEKLTDILKTRNDFELMRIEKVLKELLYSPVKNRELNKLRY